MTSETEYLKIARSDFKRVAGGSVRQAIETVGAVLFDPELTAERIGWLLKQKIDQGYLFTSEQDLERYQPTLRALEEYGIVDAIEYGVISLTDLVDVVNDPNALQRAHLAIMESEDSEEGVADTRDLHQATEELIDRFVGLASHSSDGFLEQPAPESWIRRRMLFDQGVAAAVPVSFDVKDADDTFFQHNNRVCIDAESATIPHGLCRVLLYHEGSDPSEAFNHTVPVLDVVEDDWYWDQSIDDLFGRPLQQPVVNAALVIADDSNRNLFHAPDVEMFVKSLPPGRQRRAAMEYLFGGPDCDGIK